MSQKEKYNGKIVSKTFIGIALASVACGAFYGFHDAMEIPLPHKSIETYLAFGPPLIQGCLGVNDGISIAKTGKQRTGNYPNFFEEELQGIVNQQDEKSPITKELHGGFIGCLGEGFAAGIEVAIGYGLTYFTIKMVKKFS